MELKRKQEEGSTGQESGLAALASGGSPGSGVQICSQKRGRGGGGSIKALRLMAVREQPVHFEVGVGFFGGKFSFLVGLRSWGPDRGV